MTNLILAVALSTCPNPIFNPVPPVTLTTPGVPRAAVAADYNRDGFDDLIYVSDSGNGKGALTVRLGVGNGLFGAPQSSVTNAPPRQLAVGYLNNNDGLDVAIGSNNGIALWFDAGLTFAPGGLLAGGKTALDVAITDWNQDGLPDIVGAHDDQHVRVFKGLNQFGSFSDSNLLTDASYGYRLSRIAAGDIHGAGLPSVINTALTAARLQHARNPSFVREDITTTGQPWQPLLRDLNRDGNLDLLVSYPNDHVVRVWYGKYAPAQLTTTPDTPFVEGAPINLATLTGTSASASTIEVADVTADTYLDLIVGDPHNQAVWVFAGRSDGTFASGTRLGVGAAPTSIILGRFDSDGAPDIAVLDESNNQLRVFRNACSAPANNVTPVGLEVIQSIQDPYNNVELVAGRRTFVRVYPKATTAAASVTASLTASSSANILYPRVLKPLNPREAAIADTVVHRQNLDDALLFELPPEWTVADDLRLSVEVNPDHRVTESNYNDNTAATVVRFSEMPPIKIEMVKYFYNTPQGATISPSDEQLQAIMSQLRRELPADRLVFSFREFHSTQSFWWSDPVYRTGPEDDAEDIRRDFTAGTAGTLASPVIHLVIAGRRNMGGVAEGIPGWIAVAGLDPTIAVHELGHLMGRRHVSCTPDPSDEAGPDTGFPYPNGNIGGTNPSAPLFVGLDHGDASLAPFAPQRVLWSVLSSPVADNMSYCRESWFSDYNHQNIADRFKQIFPLADPLGDFLTVNGVIGEKDTVRFSAQRINQASYIPERIKGEYAIRLLDSKGKTLAEYPFTPVNGQETTAFSTFNEIVNFAAGTRSIVIVRNGGQIASLAVSKTVPDMDAVWREGSGSSPVTIEWHGKDADGDALTADVLFSADKGANWTVLVPKTSASTLSVGALPSTFGDKTGVIRVRVSDGVHSRYQDFTGILAFGSAPAIRITSPFAGVAYAQGQTLTLDALATDRDDGTPPGTAITWTSDRDGVLGSGARLAPMLSQGTHVITATVRDRDGNAAQAQITVAIGTQGSAPSTPTAVADVSKYGRVGQAIVLDGRRSSVVGPDNLRLYWDVVQTPGLGIMGAVIDQAKPAYAQFVPAIAGTYRFRLNASAGIALASTVVEVVVTD